MTEQPSPIQDIRDRHWQADAFPYEVESHRHGERGCRCLSCDVTTGYLISVGVDCDESPEAAKASDGGCLVEVLTYQQATALIAAHEDRGVLLAEVRRLEALVAAHQRVEMRLIKESMPAWPPRTRRRRREKVEEVVGAEEYIAAATAPLTAEEAAVLRDDIRSGRIKRRKARMLDGQEAS